MARFATKVRQKVFTRSRTLSTKTTDDESSVDDDDKQRASQCEVSNCRRPTNSHQSISSEVGVDLLQGNVRVSKLLSGIALHGRPEVDDTHSQATTQEPCSSINSDESTILEFSEPDCYGGRHPIETKRLITSKLFHFENQLVAIPHHKKIALRQAQEKCPHLLTDDFKLMFLRCECFNEQLAAKRYAKYWENRLEIFGPIKAFQRLSLSEALRDDTVALSTGFITLTGTQDESGRNIIYGDPTKQNIGAYTTESMARAIWYVLHAALEDETSQKKGVVFVADLRIVKLSLFDRDLVRILAASVQGCIPVRLSGLHGCSPPRIFGVIFPVLKALLGERLGKRIRIHSSHNQEHVVAGLAKYGMPSHVIPAQLGGGAELCHNSWLQQRRLNGA